MACGFFAGCLLALQYPQLATDPITAFAPQLGGFLT